MTLSMPGARNGDGPCGADEAKQEGDKREESITPVVLELGVNFDATSGRIH